MPRTGGSTKPRGQSSVAPPTTATSSKPTSTAVETAVQSTKDTGDHSCFNTQVTGDSALSLTAREEQTAASSQPVAFLLPEESGAAPPSDRLGTRAPSDLTMEGVSNKGGGESALTNRSNATADQGVSKEMSKNSVVEAPPESTASHATQPYTIASHGHAPEARSTEILAKLQAVATLEGLDQHGYELKCAAAEIVLAKLLAAGSVETVARKITHDREGATVCDWIVRCITQAAGGGTPWTSFRDEDRIARLFRYIESVEPTALNLVDSNSEKWSISLGILDAWAVIRFAGWGDDTESGTQRAYANFRRS